MSSKRPPNTERLEMPDQTPMAIPAGFRRPPSLQEQIRALVRHEGYQAALNSGEVESMEEADDFDIPDDDFPASPHEFAADEQDFRGMVRNEQQRLERDQLLSAQREKSKPKSSKSSKSKKVIEDSDEESEDESED